LNEKGDYPDVIFFLVVPMDVALVLQNLNDLKIIQLFSSGAKASTYNESIL